MTNWFVKKFPENNEKIRQVNRKGSTAAAAHPMESAQSIANTRLMSFGSNRGAPVPGPAPPVGWSPGHGARPDA
jgi:hypothetical protein